MKTFLLKLLLIYASPHKIKDFVKYCKNVYPFKTNLFEYF